MNGGTKMTFTNQHVAIIGATGGIGGALARQLAAAGCRLSLAARDPSRLNPLVSELGAHGASVDATEAEQVDRFLEGATDRWGRLDGVVNAAGSLLLKPAHSTEDAEWASVLATNLTTAFHVLRASVRILMRGEGGAIVLMASAVAMRGMIHHEAVAAAKAGVVGLAKSAAATYARHRIRVNCVAPGLTRTPLTAGLTRHEPTLKASTALHPLGRIGEADEVAGAIRWFLSSEQSWVTGQVLAVDGGLSTIQPRPASGV